MTATDELRRMLDERGVEWMPSVWSAKDETFYKVGEVGYLVTEMSSGRMKVSVEGYLAPEQAIAATLGETPTPPPPTMPEQPPYDLLIDLLRDEWGIDVSWDGLRRFWYVGLTDEGVRMRDEREATLGRGECRNISPKLGNGEFTCEECLARVYGSGGQWFDANWKYHKFNYCPNCGRKVVE